jgi:CheY-like chemotaxis protein
VQGKALSLMVDYDMFMPTRFTGDRGRVRQVLTNLIGNAVKFTETGHVLVRVTGIPAEAPAAHRITVMVEDSGIGIAPAMLEHIFGEFNQVEDDRNRKFEGTGLGLSIARRLVRLMEGDIWAESEPGTGSSFAFSFELPAAGDSAGAGTPDLAGQQVVIVDPVAASAAILEGQLLAIGLAVTVFAEGADALAALPDGTAAIFAEAALPDMSAADLAGALENDGLPIPVFALTPTRSGPDQPGCARTLHRPVPRQALLQALAGVRPQPVTPPLQSLREMRVLAAEDNKTNQLVLGKMLRDLRIELRFAANGVEAASGSG